MSENTAHHDEQKKKQQQHDMRDATVLGAITDTVNRHGNAVKEFSVGYTGKDRVSGQVLSKGLKAVSESNVNPGFAEQNMKQQAGFSAEIATTARENAQAAIDGKTSSHTTRTDDMTRQPDGKGHTIPYFLGAINEEALALENERAVLKRRLTIERRRLEENRHLMGGGFERAVKLIGEARQVGLIDSSTHVPRSALSGLLSI